MKRLARLVVACLVVGGCSTAPAGQPAAPLTRIPDDASAIGHWRHTTARTLSMLLARQPGGAAILQPGGPPRVTATLAAALVAKAASPDVVGAYTPRTGLFEAANADSLYVTWLVARHSTRDGQRAARLPVPSTALAQSVRARMAALAGPITAGDAGAASSFLLGLRTLALIGASGAPAFDAVAACRQAATASTLVDAATWLELASSAGRSCDAGTAVRLARARIRGGGDTPDLASAAELRAAVVVLAADGHNVQPPPLCIALLQERRADGFLPHRDPAAYLACADAIAVAGGDVTLSGPVTEYLTLIVALRGALPQTQSVNPMAKVYAVGTLTSLGFRDDVIEAVGTGPTTSGSADPDHERLLDAIARRKPPTYAGAVPAALGRNLAGAVLLAGSLLATGTCPASAIDALIATYQRAPVTTGIDELLRRAIILGALSGCPTPHTALLAREKALVRDALAALRHPDGTFSDPPNVQATWKGQEALCQLDGYPAIAQDAVMTLLPDFSLTGAHANLSYDRLYAAVRLTNLVTTGCSGGWWGAGPARRSPKP